MRLLLDTHVLLWLLLDHPNLGSAARARLGAAGQHPMVSIVSLWEVAIKIMKRGLPIPFDEVEAAAVGVFELLPLRPDHVRALLSLPSRPDHRDPFDRMLLAQARHEGLTIMTEDAKLRGYGVPVIGCA